MMHPSFSDNYRHLRLQSDELQREFNPISHLSSPMSLQDTVPTEDGRVPHNIPSNQITSSHTDKQKLPPRHEHRAESRTSANEDQQHHRTVSTMITQQAIFPHGIEIQPYESSQQQDRNRYATTPADLTMISNFDQALAEVQSKLDNSRAAISRSLERDQYSHAPLSEIRLTRQVSIVESRRISNHGQKPSEPMLSDLPPRSISDSRVTSDPLLTDSKAFQNLVLKQTRKHKKSRDHEENLFTDKSSLEDNTKRHDSTWRHDETKRTDQNLRYYQQIERIKAQAAHDAMLLHQASQILKSHPTQSSVEINDNYRADNYTNTNSLKQSMYVLNSTTTPDIGKSCSQERDQKSSKKHLKSFITAPTPFVDSQANFGILSHPHTIEDDRMFTISQSPRQLSNNRPSYENTQQDRITASYENTEDLSRQPSQPSEKAFAHLRSQFKYAAFNPDNLTAQVGLKYRREPHQHERTQEIRHSYSLEQRGAEQQHAQTIAGRSVDRLVRKSFTLGGIEQFLPKREEVYRQEITHETQGSQLNTGNSLEETKTPFLPTLHQTAAGSIKSTARQRVHLNNAHLLDRKAVERIALDRPQIEYNSREVRTDALQTLTSNKHDSSMRYQSASNLNSRSLNPAHKHSAASVYTVTATLTNSNVTPKVQAHQSFPHLNSARIEHSLAGSADKPRDTISPMAGINRATVDILKSELQMTKTQLQDARQSNTFLKKEKAIVESERDEALEQVQDLINILKQRDEELADLSVKYTSQQEFGELIAEKAREAEELYKKNIACFDDELLRVKDMKMKNIDRLFSSVVQLRGGLEHMDETVGETHFMRPFIGHFAKVCAAIEHELAQQQILPDSDRHLSELVEKYDLRKAKRAQNFAKFRKEVKLMIKTNYSALLEQQANELAETKQQLQYAMKQLKTMSKHAENMRVEHEQASIAVQETIASKQRMEVQFQMERDKLSQLHLLEIHGLEDMIHKLSEELRHQAQVGKVGRSHEIEREQKRDPSTEPRYSKAPNHETNDHAEVIRQAEELHLLSLQNEQYKQTLEGHKLLVRELYKALKQSNETSRKLRLCQLSDYQASQNHEFSDIHTTSSAIDMPISDPRYHCPDWLRLQDDQHITIDSEDYRPSGNDIQMEIDESKQAAIFVHTAQQSTGEQSVATPEDPQQLERDERKLKKLAKRLKRQNLIPSQVVSTKPTQREFERLPVEGENTNPNSFINQFANQDLAEIAPIDRNQFKRQHNSLSSFGVCPIVQPMSKPHSNASSQFTIASQMPIAIAHERR